MIVASRTDIISPPRLTIAERPRLSDTARAAARRAPRTARRCPLPCPLPVRLAALAPRSAPKKACSRSRIPCW